MEKEKPNEISRGRGGNLRGNTRGIASGATKRPRTEDKPPSIERSAIREEPKKEEIPKREVERGITRGSLRARARARGNLRMMPRRNRRLIPARRERLQRAQNVVNYMNRGQRGRFRGRFNRFNGFRNRRGGLRSIFISGLPRYINNYKLANFLKKEGRLIRVSVLKNRFGASRGIAFAEFQNPRDAWKVINNWNGKNINGSNIFVTYKKRPPINKRYTPYFNKRYNNYGNGQRNFNNFGVNYPQKPRIRGNFRGGMRGARGVPRGIRGTRAVLRGSGMINNNDKN